MSGPAQRWHCSLLFFPPFEKLGVIQSHARIAALVAVGHRLKVRWKDGPRVNAVLPHVGQMLFKQIPTEGILGAANSSMWDEKRTELLPYLSLGRICGVARDNHMQNRLLWELGGPPTHLLVLAMLQCQRQRHKGRMTSEAPWVWTPSCSSNCLMVVHGFAHE